MPLTEEERAERRTAKARRRGLLLVFTGAGKGKSTAAFGLAVRAAGNRMPIKVVQFIKGSWKTGERDERLRDPGVPMSDHHLARAAFEMARDAVAGGNYRMVVLDEVLGSITAREANLDRDLDEEERPHDFDAFVQHMDGYLCELKDAQIRGGLHVLEAAPRSWSTSSWS
jgi:ATP:corrinoid adenosyltransferase